MPQKPTAPAAPDNLDLPHFNDRIPDLLLTLRDIGNQLQKAKPNQTYIPYFEDLYSVAHNLKGITKILSCPRAMEDFIVALNAQLVRALSGSKVCRQNKEAGSLFLALADELDRSAPCENCDFRKLRQITNELGSIYSEDLPHEERLSDIPAHLFNVNEFVSKKAREIKLLNLNFCVVEDEARLDDIPIWRTRLNEALSSAEFGRGLVVNFLPFLSPEGSHTLKLWAWVAAGSESRAGLKQRIKTVLPKASLSKL